MTETIPAPSGPGTVVLDIGAGTGALILHTPADLDGREIEISPNATPCAARTHSQVRERRTPASTRYAAVYPNLAAGDYTIWRNPVTPAGTVTITGGHITTCHWTSLTIRRPAQGTETVLAATPGARI
jgi:hypothetical protein